MADFEADYMWKEFEQYDVVRDMVRLRSIALTGRSGRYRVERIGDDGVPMLKINETPLKSLHWLAGPQNATMWMMEQPDEMKALAKIQSDKTLRLLESVVDIDNAQIFMLLDNMDAMFYAPYLFDDYCYGFLMEAADIIHSRGKNILRWHACGRNRIVGRVGEVKIDMLEGVSQPPLGDAMLSETRSRVVN